MVTKTERNSRLFGELLKRLSLEQCIEYLICGFIKENLTNDRYILYPSALQKLGISYLNGINFFIKFKMSSLCVPTMFKFVDEHYMEMIPDKHFLSTFLLDLPIPIDAQNTLKWKLQFHGNWMPNGHYFIGIVSDKFSNFDNSIWNKTWQHHYDTDDFNQNDQGISDIYGLCGNADIETNTVWNGCRDIFEEYGSYIECGQINYKNYDIICIEYDGKAQRLTLTNNKTKQLICGIRLNEEPSADIKYWYPAISMPNTTANQDTDWLRII